MRKRIDVPPENWSGDNESLLGLTGPVEDSRMRRGRLSDGQIVRFVQEHEAGGAEPDLLAVTDG